MLIVSTWKIVLGSVTILDFGDWMNNEQSLRTSGLVEVSPALGTNVPLIFPRKNVVTNLRFSRVKNFTTDALARDFLATHAAQLTFSALGSCVISLNQNILTHTLTIAGAIIAQDGYNARTEASRFIADYNVIGGAMTMV
jgi:hypothetical protein